MLVWSFRALRLGTHPLRDWDDQEFEVGSTFAQKAGQPICRVSSSSSGTCWVTENTLRTTCTCHTGCIITCVGNVTVTKQIQQRIGNFAGDTKGGQTRIQLHVNTSPHILCLGYQEFHPGVFVRTCCTLLSLRVWPAVCLAVRAIHQVIFKNRVGSRVASDELAKLWRRIQELYSSIDVRERLSHLQLSMLCDVQRPYATPPSLHAKAAETKHLVPVVAALMAEICDGTPTSWRRADACKDLGMFYQISIVNPCSCPHMPALHPSNAWKPC